MKTKFVHIKPLTNLQILLFVIIAEAFELEMRKNIQSRSRYGHTYGENQRQP